MSAPPARCWRTSCDLALPIHDDLRFRAFAAFGTSGAHGFVRLFHRLTTDTFANALEG